MSRVPIVIVFGATGTGKSKLAIQLAKKFNGEIISADSIQVYKGLDIASNKVTQAERTEVPHHMLDVLRPMDRYSVTDYRNRALPIIDDILKRQKLPIVVGGTNYYIEAILWKILVESENEETNELVFNRYQLLKDPSSINKWRTYKAFVLPTRQQNRLNSATVNDCDNQTDYDKRNVTKEDLNLLIEQIKSISCDFKNSLKSIQDTMNISFKYYKRTLYHPDTSRSSSDEASGGGSRFNDSEIVDVVNLERLIMDDYVRRNIEHVIKFLNQRESEHVSNLGREVWEPLRNQFNLSESYAVLSETLVPFFSNFSFLSGSEFWSLKMINGLSGSCADVVEGANCFVEFYDSHECLGSQCYYILKKFIERIRAILTIRVKRLTLIRSVDDEIMLDFDSNELHTELRLVDPEMAKMVHLNNRRKVIRALQVYFQSGELLSEVQNKMQSECGSSTFGPLRFPNACLLWLRSDMDVLESRLKDRIEQMMDMGLIAELLEFHKQYNIQRLAYNLEADYSKGIFQSIGFKEFHSYLMLSEEERDTKKGKKLLREGIDALKVATIKYSKYQTRYVLNKFVRIPDSKQVPPLFQLDVTDLEMWEENVEKIAYCIVENYLKGEDLRKLEYSTIPIEQPDPTRYEKGEFYCDICQRTFIGNYQWQKHYRSKRHRKALYGQKVRELKERIAGMKMPSKELQI